MRCKPAAGTSSGCHASDASSNCDFAKGRQRVHASHIAARSGSCHAASSSQAAFHPGYARANASWCLERGYSCASPWCCCFHGVTPAVGEWNALQLRQCRNGPNGIVPAHTATGCPGPVPGRHVSCAAWFETRDASMPHLENTARGLAACLFDCLLLPVPADRLPPAACSQAQTKQWHSLLAHRCRQQSEGCRLLASRLHVGQTQAAQAAQPLEAGIRSSAGNPSAESLSHLNSGRRLPDPGRCPRHRTTSAWTRRR